MSILEATVYSVIRCLLLVLVTLPPAFRISRYMREVRNPLKLWLWGLIGFPLFVPELLSGYSYSNFSLNLVQWPWLNELLYLSRGGGDR